MDTNTQQQMFSFMDCVLSGLLHHGLLPLRQPALFYYKMASVVLFNLFFTGTAHLVELYPEVERSQCARNNISMQPSSNTLSSCTSKAVQRLGVCAYAILPIKEKSTYIDTGLHSYTRQCLHRSAYVGKRTINNKIWLTP